MLVVAFYLHYKYSVKFELQVNVRFVRGQRMQLDFIMIQTIVLPTSIVPNIMVYGLLITNPAQNVNSGTRNN